MKQKNGDGITKQDLLDAFKEFGFAFKKEVQASEERTGTKIETKIAESEQRILTNVETKFTESEQSILATMESRFNDTEENILAKMESRFVDTERTLLAKMGMRMAEFEQQILAKMGMRMAEMELRIDDHAQAYNSKVLTRFDQWAGTIDTVRTDQAITNNQINELRNDVNEHEKRISELEAIKN